MLRRAKLEEAHRQPLWLLRRNDQALLGGAALAAILGLAILWHVRGGSAGNLVRLDEIPRREIRFQVDLNQADWPELCELPGVGETLARRIVEHRQRHGPFRGPEELRQVRGIGPKTFEKLRPHLAPVKSPPQ